MDPRAQSIVNQVASLSGQFGVTVTVKRIVQAATPIRNVFGTPMNATTETFTANVIIESQKIDLMATIAGGKPKEVLKLITNAGTFLLGDEIVFNGHTYKVEYLQPVPFVGVDVVDFVHATREVD
ncbi:hypothetical protein DNHGIG_25840 [Collibacillus ludicampi]|uniref:Phage protein n=1 Tax=Collibacillus ludicampi TaxID=2771369 RepID=A0AAV4LGS1_9BACL|nr:hypothetical protein [Collibacillus ludicampi]GIM47035.1 hypothetical protein DNHGIG_25840 [Collibacillus ludicampi]